MVEQYSVLLNWSVRFVLRCATCNCYSSWRLGMVLCQRTILNLTVKYFQIEMHLTIQACKL